MCSHTQTHTVTHSVMNMPLQAHIRAPKNPQTEEISVNIWPQEATERATSLSSLEKATQLTLWLLNIRGTEGSERTRIIEIKIFTNFLSVSFFWLNVCP